MATTKPRMMLTLEPQTFATFKRFALLSGTPASTVVARLLDQARPEFEKLGVMLQQARDLQSRTKEEQSEFLARIDLMANRADVFREVNQADMVSAVGLGPVSGVASAAPIPGSSKSNPKKAPHSLIHTNYSPKSSQTRLPAGSSSNKKGAKRETS